MLNLFRKKGQSILIGDDITVTIVSVRPTDKGEMQVEVGIEAPKYKCVDREEVRVRRESRIKTVFTGNNEEDA